MSATGVPKYKIAGSLVTCIDNSPSLDERQNGDGRSRKRFGSCDRIEKNGNDKLFVMPGLVPGIHVHAKSWMAGTSPAMTTLGEEPLARASTAARHCHAR